MKAPTKPPTCKSPKAVRFAWQDTHHQDFTEKDLWKHLCMNRSGNFVYGFDFEEEAKAYAEWMRKHGRPVKIVPLSVAIKMELPPTWEHNWNYDRNWNIPKELKNKIETA